MCVPHPCMLVEPNASSVACGFLPEVKPRDEVLRQTFGLSAFHRFCACADSSHEKQDFEQFLADQYADDESESYAC